MKHDGNLDVRGRLAVGQGQIGGAAYTLSRYEPHGQFGGASGLQDSNREVTDYVNLYPFHLPAPVAAGYLGLIVSGVPAGTIAGTFRETLHYQCAIYTKATGTNYSLLSLLTAQSFGISVSGQSGNRTFSQPMTTHAGGYSYGSTNGVISTNYTGQKYIQFPFKTVLSAGNYWLGIMCTRSTINANAGIWFKLSGNAVGAESEAAPLGKSPDLFSTGTDFSADLLHLRQGYGFLSTNVGTHGGTTLPNAITLSNLLPHDINMIIIPHMILWSS